MVDGLRTGWAGSGEVGRLVRIGMSVLLASRPAPSGLRG